jgi:uncharacterized protein (TIGR02186 family)
MARRLLTSAVVSLLLLQSSAARAQEDGKVRVEPAEIAVGLFYGGQELLVSAAAPAGCDMVFKVSGKREDLRLKKKGKKGGILWMNVGELTFKSIPALYMIKSSRPLENTTSRKALDRAGLGYEALAAELTAGQGDDVRSHFEELIKLKEKEKLFSVDESGVEFRKPEAGSREALATFFLPPKTPVGEYKVEAFSFKNGEQIARGSGSFGIEFARTTAFMASLARNHGLLYGCLAVLIAILAGLLTGFIFRGRSRTR